MAIYNLPYEKRDFLNQNERGFLKTLTDILGDKYFVFPKVRMWDLLKIKKTTHLYRYIGLIRSKHVDFVICDKENILPVLVIELDGDSHLKDVNTEKKDDFEFKAFLSAQLPLQHFKNREINNDVLIHSVLRKHLTDLK